MRLKIIIVSVLLAFISSGLAFPVKAWAQSKIAVVNIQEVMSDSKAARSIQKQLDQYRNSFQDEFSKYERNLLEEQRKLVESRQDLTPEEFSKKRDAFEAQLLETRKLVQKRQQTLEKAAGEAVGELRLEVVKIVAEIADKNDYDMVITKQNVVLAQKDMDITVQVMTQLDKNIKEIKLKVETH